MIPVEYAEEIMHPEIDYLLLGNGPFWESNKWINSEFIWEFCASLGRDYPLAMFSDAQSVPEPSTILLCLVALAVVGWWKWKRAA